MVCGDGPDHMIPSCSGKGRATTQRPSGQHRRPLPDDHGCSSVAGGKRRLVGLLPAGSRAATRGGPMAETDKTGAETGKKRVEGVAFEVPEGADLPPGVPTGDQHPRTDRAQGMEAAG